MALAGRIRHHSRTNLLITNKVYITQTVEDYHWRDCDQKCSNKTTMSPERHAVRREPQTQDHPKKCQWSKTETMTKLLYDIVTMLIMCGKSMAVDSCEWLTWRKSPRLPIPAHPLSAKGGNREGYNSDSGLWLTVNRVMNIIMKLLTAV